MLLSLSACIDFYYDRTMLHINLKSVLCVIEIYDMLFGII